MPQGQQTIPEIQWAIIRLERLLTREQIAMSLNVSICTVKRVISHFHKFGTIPNSGEKEATERKSKKHLRDVDVEVISYRLSFNLRELMYNYGSLF